MNPFQHLFQSESDAPLTEEELDAQDAEARKARIKHHRDNVRNGPVRQGYITAGQQRRHAARRKAASERKMNKRHRRNFKDGQATVATLRGHLIILGQVECRDAATSFTDAQKRESAVWIVRKYGERDDSGKIVESDTLFLDALKAARDDLLTKYGVDA